MVSSQDPTPAYDPAPTHIPIILPPTKGSAEVMRRQTTLLDNLGTELSTSRHNERFVDVRRNSPTRRHEETHKRKLIDLPPCPRSSRHTKARRENEHGERRNFSRQRDERRAYY